MGEGLKSIETKFSLLVFPVFLPFVFSENKSKLNIKITSALILSGFSYVVMSLITAFVDYQSTSNIDVFFYGELGVGIFQEGSFLHPTYAAFLFNKL